MVNIYLTEILRHDLPSDPRELSDEDDAMEHLKSFSVLGRRRRATGTRP